MIVNFKTSIETKEVERYLQVSTIPFDLTEQFYYVGILGNFQDKIIVPFVNESLQQLTLEVKKFLQNFGQTPTDISFKLLNDSEINLRDIVAPLIAEFNDKA